MADGQLFKPEKDFTKEADKQIPEAQELAQVRNLSWPLGVIIIDRRVNRTMYKRR